MYEWKDNMLYIRKVDIDPIDMNVMSDLQESYQRYVTSTIYADMKYLEELIRDIKGLRDITLSVHVGDLVQQTYSKTQVSSGIYYYPVYVSFHAGAYTLQKDVEILRIPYMDDYGHMNFFGSQKVLLGVQRASDDISYEAATNTFNIAMPHANIRIQSVGKGVRLYSGTTKYPLEYVISAMLYAVGDNSTNLRNVFRNVYLNNTLQISPLTENIHMYQYMDGFGLLQKYAGAQYELGSTREALNEAFTMESAIGKRLSRKTLDYPANTVITRAMLTEFKRAGIYVLYVHTPSAPKGYYLGFGHVYVLHEVKAGAPNCRILRELLPQYESYPYMPHDVRFDEPYLISDGAELTNDLIDLFRAANILEIPVRTSTKSSKTIVCSLEQEIVGNGTARLSELCDSIPDGRSADEWVYYWNNPTFKHVDDTHLTPHDLMAIMSAMGYMRTSGTIFLLNRDESYLKQLLLANEIFSETLRSTLKDFVQMYKGRISSFLNRSDNDNNPFLSLSHKWFSTLNSERYTAPIDSLNVMSEVSQVSHVSTIVGKSAAVPDVMRHLSMPFYGRICPYETPAGAKLGLVNTRAIGAKVINGLLHAPYKRVIGTSDGIRISDKVTYLSVKDEIGYKFGDMLTFTYDENGKILNTPVVAKIPNPVPGDETFIFATVNAYDLAGGYVSAYPEQFLSSTAAMIPFACSTDPVRVSYGLNQLRQSIYVHHSQKPLVQTFMYSDIFKYSNSYEYKATCSGTVKSINTMEVVITSGDSDVSVPIMRNLPIGQLDAVIDLTVKAGDTVRAGQVIARAMKYPQDYVVRAPYRCRILGVTNNSVEIMRLSEGSSFQGGAVDLTKCDTIALSNSRILRQTATFMNLRVSVGDILEKGDIIATSTVSPDGIYTPSRNPLVAFIMDGYNHEDGVSACELSGYNYTSIITHAVSCKLSREKYATAHASPLSGFSYCGENDVAGKVVTWSQNNRSSYDMEVRADFKHKGIPFECTRDDKDSLSRVYKWHLLDFKPLKEGDKMSGRHGNKGVVSKMHKNSDMPLTMNGRQVEFMLNPCGIPSRMNMGQVWEGHLGLVAEVLGIRINSDPFNGASPDDISYLMKFAHTLANTDGVESNRSIFQAVCSVFDKLPSGLFDAVWDNISNVVDWRGAFNSDGTAKLYDPVTGTYFENDVLICYPYFMKLVQEGEEKMNFRGGPLSNNYSRTTSQPAKGDNSASGQRIGEMEFVALAAYGASALIEECCNEKSDNIGARVNAHCKQLGLKDYHVPENMCSPRSVENTLYMLEGVGVHVDVPEDVCDTSFRTSSSKYTYDLRKLVRNQLSPVNEYKHVTTLDDLDSILD